MTPHEWDIVIVFTLLYICAILWIFYGIPILFYGDLTRTQKVWGGALCIIGWAWLIFATWYHFNPVF